VTREDYFARWAALHGGVQPESAKLISGWLTISYHLARPLTRVGIGPNAVTLLGLLVALAAPLFAWRSVVSSSVGWLWLAVAACAVNGLLDTLDGAVAVVSGRTSDWGYVIDSVSDRVSDCALMVTLYFAGSPAWICVTVAVLTVCQEYARARATGVGVAEVGVVTVWERPSRIIVTAVFTGLAAWAPYSLARDQWALIGAAAALVLAVVGLSQLLLALHKRLA
jgi:phosphatidylglycerophosphate synthase